MPKDSTSSGGGSLTVEDCLAEGCYAGISATDRQTNRTIRVTNTAIMCTNYFEDEGEGAQYRTFGPMFKATGGMGPQWIVNNCVFAYETHDGAAMNMNGQFGTGRIRDAFSRWSGTNNFMCVLGAGGLPSGYPTLPAGMTLLTGQAARDKWTAKRAELIQLITDDTVIPPVVTIVNKSIMSINPTTGVLSTDTTDDISSQTFVLTAFNADSATTGNLTVSVA
jgi:hypothetical protein